MTDAAVAGYGPADTARRIEEPGKPTARSPFARDRARVLHSAALRRLAATTQVVEPGVSDFLRTRLTHSLECAQIARELGAELGCDPDLVDTAGLAHDLGHPPFGHNGESVLDRIAAEIGGFEGNAQTFRVLTRLEPKVIAPDGTRAGLNPTRATLDATTKYPWPRREGSPKFGVYADDIAAFDWLRTTAPDGRRCLEAQVMDFADDVAYSVHDLEDGLHAGHVAPALLADEAALRDALAAAEPGYLRNGGPAELAASLTALGADLGWPAAFDRGWRDLAELKALTSTLIGRFTAAAVAATRQAHGDAPLRRYAADLVIPEETLRQVAALKALVAVQVMARPEAQRRYAEQREILETLVADVVLRAPEPLEPTFRPAWQQAADDAARLRVVIDQVASWTDLSALARFRALTR